MSEHDLNQWLDNATKQLPSDVVASLRAELLAHYEDALADYTSQGMDDQAAHHKALHDLGAADTVADGLNEVYRGQMRYKWGIFASAAIMLNMLSFPMIYGLTGWEELSANTHALLNVFDLVVVALTAYAIFALRSAVAWRLGRHDLDHYFMLAVGGLTLGIVGDVLHRTFIGDTLTPYYLAVSSEFGIAANAFLAMSTLGRLMIVIGLFVVSYALFTTAGNFYGLRIPVALILGMMSAFLLVAIVSFYAGRSSLGEAFQMLAALVHILLLWPLLMVLFFRLSYRDPIKRGRFAL